MGNRLFVSRRFNAIRKLGDLEDVKVSGVSDGETPVYNSVTGDWESGAASGKGTDMLVDSKALADDGVLYDTIQEAIENATNIVFVGPGTFNESVTIDKSNFMLSGVGRSTLIDGGAIGDSLEIDASDVRINRLALQTTSGQGNNYSALVDTGNADKIHSSGLFVLDSDQHGIDLRSGSDYVFNDLRVESADEKGVYVTASDVIIEDYVVQSAGGNGIESSGDRTQVLGGRVEGSGDNGILFSGADQMLIQNLVRNSNQNNSGSVDLDTSSATNLTKSLNKDLT